MAFREFKFRYAYALVAMTSELVYENPDDEYLASYFDPAEPDFLKKIVQPHKTTLLHDFLTARKEWLDEYTIHKVGGYVLEEYIGVLETYGITLPDKTLFCDEEGEPNDDVYIEAGVQPLLELVRPRIVDEAFNILYNDRMFLLKFNSIASEVVSTMKKADHPDVLARDGVVKRFTAWPIWLRNGVFHRDKGRCQVCGKDLTHLITIDEEVNIDHIVPLAAGGTNDPTNLQLLCREDNLQKGGNHIFTSEKYQTYW